VANISFEQLRQMFWNMKNRSGWDISGDLVSGYFFADRNPIKLEPLATQLVEMDYRLVSIYEADDRSTYFLHVERIETHTPSSLLRHTIEMNALAAKFGVASYDGMDAGPVPRAPS